MGIFGDLAKVASGPRASLAALRSKRDALLQERSAIEGEMLPAGDADRRIDEAVNAMARDMHDRLQIGAANVPGFQGRLTGDPAVKLALEVAALLNPAGTAAALKRLAMEHRGGAVGLSVSERSAKVTSIEQRLAELETAEEELIGQAEEAGVVLSRRPDADPLVVLGLDRRSR